MTPRATEAQLIAAAQAGDEQALDALIAALQPKLYRFIRRMCPLPEDAEDILQETLITLVRRLPEFRGASSLSTYLYTVARSHCIKKLRTSKFAPTRREPVERLAELASGDDPQAAAADREAWGLVSQVLETMELEQREVLLLRDIEQLSAAEVSAVVGVSVGAVKSRLHRARKTLRERLQPLVAEPTPECPDIALAFSQHAEGELGAQACAIMQSHVDSCPRCSAICDGLKADLRTCQEAPGERVPMALQARIREQLREVIAARRG